jgi:hypothetical protein
MFREGTPRRTFLLGGAACLAGGAIVSALEGCYRSGTPLADSESARRIGARYAGRYPEGATGLFGGWPPENEKDWATRIEALRRADFEADRMVQVEGWWLAETELRLCVLLHAGI